MADDDTPRRQPRGEPMSQTGYRCTDALKFELTIAGAFVDESGLQAVIDLAVQEFVGRLRKSKPDFGAAVDAAAASRANIRGNVRQLRGGGETA